MAEINGSAALAAQSLATVLAELLRYANHGEPKGARFPFDGHVDMPGLIGTALSQVIDIEIDAYRGCPGWTEELEMLETASDEIRKFLKVWLG